MSIESENLATIRQFIDAYNHNVRSAYEEFISDDFEWIEGATAVSPKGRTGGRREILQAISLSESTLREESQEITSCIASGNAVAVEYIWRAVNIPMAMKVEARAAAFYLVKDGKIFSSHEFICNFITQPIPIILKEYVDAAHKFSFSYNTNWTKNEAGMVPPVLAWFSSPPWNCPGVQIAKRPDTEAATLKDLITKVAFKDRNPVISSTSPITNSHGITADVIVFKSKSLTDNSILDNKMYGFKANGFWWMMGVYQAPRLGTLESVRPDDIFNSWQFLK